MQLSFFDIWNNSKVKQSLLRLTKSNKKNTPKTKRSPTKKEVNDPQLHRLWLNIAKTYFPDEQQVLSYSITWSSRSQKRTLASCNISNQRVIVARELNYPEYYSKLEPLLYHEMCHAVIGLAVNKKNGKRQWHGRDFKLLENLHPEMQAFNSWVKNGGWLTCVRSDRGKRAYRNRVAV